MVGLQTSLSWGRLEEKIKALSMVVGVCYLCFYFGRFCIFSPFPRLYGTL